LTTNNRLFLLSFFSIIWALVIYLVLESDVVIFGQQSSSDDDLEDASGTMLFEGMSE
jgi:hypothetical protein